MKAICVDDESLIMQLTVAMCRDLPELDDVQGFTTAGEALKWAEEHPVDVALLDIDMPGMNGLMLAKEIKERNPDAAILFLTGYAQYAVEAFAMHASGYLLKPVSKERLAQEVAFALSGQQEKKAPKSRVVAQTFGQFELFADGKAVNFSRAKAKELMAYLIDRQGGSVTRAEAFAAMWEDEFYDRSMQKQFDVIIRSLRKTLDEHGISRILEMKSGNLRAVPEEMDCDLYRFMAGDVQAVNAYRGEYMSSYSWASLTESYLYRKANPELN